MVFEHSVNVALICNVFGDWMHLDEGDKQVLTVAGQESPSPCAASVCKRRPFAPVLL